MSCRLEIELASSASRITWIDGTPPQLVVCDPVLGSKPPRSAPALVDEAQRFVPTIGEVVRFYRRRVGSKNASIPTPDVFFEIARSEGASPARIEIHETIVSTDQLDAWLQWSAAFASELCDTPAPSFFRVCLSVPAELANAGMLDRFPRAPFISGILIDDGLSDKHTFGAMQFADGLLDEGLCVEARVLLCPDIHQRWESLIDSWRAATRNGIIEFACLNTVQDGRIDIVEVGNRFRVFVDQILTNEAFNFWSIKPLADVAGTLTLGTVSMLHHAGRRYSFDNGARPFRLTAVSMKCNCPNSEICSAVRAHATSEADWSRSYLPLLCDLVRASSQYIVEALAGGIRLQQFLTNRPDDARFRVAVRDGVPYVWTERVELEHESTRR